MGSWCLLKGQATFIRKVVGQMEEEEEGEGEGEEGEEEKRRKDPLCSGSVADGKPSSRSALWSLGLAG